MNHKMSILIVSLSKTRPFYPSVASKVAPHCFANQFSCTERLCNLSQRPNYAPKGTCYVYLFFCRHLFSFDQRAWVKWTVLTGKEKACARLQVSGFHWIVGQTHQFNKCNLFPATRAQYIDKGVVGNSPRRSPLETGRQPGFYSNAITDSLVKADHKVKRFPGEALD